MKIGSTLVTQPSVRLQESVGSNDYPLIVNADTGRAIWIQNADPAGSATNGDIWFQIP